MGEGDGRGGDVGVEVVGEARVVGVGGEGGDDGLFGEFRGGGRGGGGGGGGHGDGGNWIFSERVESENGFEGLKVMG